MIFACASLITTGLIIYQIDIQSSVRLNFQFGEYFLESLVRPTVNTILLGMSTFAFFRQKTFAVHLSVLAIVFNFTNITYNLIFQVRYEYYDLTELIFAIIGFYGVMAATAFLTWKYSQDIKEIKNVPQQWL